MNPPNQDFTGYFRDAKYYGWDAVEEPIRSAPAE
jgi:hypothetical protein